MLARRLIGLGVLLAVGCSASKPLSGPTFQVRVSLAASAKAELAALGERIKVVAYFDGDSWRRPLYMGGPFRAVFLGEQVTEIGLDEAAHFRSETFPEDKVKDLLWGRYFVTINVTSARISSSDNLLNCSVPLGTSSMFVDKIINVNCTLIR